MFDPSNWSVAISIGLFVVAAVVIGFAGTKLAELADRLADLTGLGEAIAGTILLGAATSLPGIITSVITASQGYPELAVSNALGGIAAQTVFIAAADVVYRNANLEHAAASITNIFQGTLLIVLLCMPLLAMSAPSFTIWGIHPISPLLFVAYIYGLFMARQVESEPTWQPEETAETEQDEPDEEPDDNQNTTGIWMRFGALALVVGVAGWVVGQTGGNIANSTGMSQTVVGTLLTAVATSLPELVTTVAAVRRRALTLAVSGIIGGNAFDTLFVAASDFAYRDGSIYHAVGSQQILLGVLNIILTGILLMGLVRREERGIANIGFEGITILLLYIGTVVLLILGG